MENMSNLNIYRVARRKFILIWTLMDRKATFTARFSYSGNMTPQDITTKALHILNYEMGWNAKQSLIPTENTRISIDKESLQKWN